MRDVVIPYKDSGTTEIEYSILSLDNIDHGVIHRVSSVPKKYQTIPLNPFHDVEIKLNYAMRELNLSEEFIFSNDDFFIMYPTTIPCVHKGYLKDVLDRRPHDSYRVALQDTYDYLIREGIEQPLCFEVHMPMIFNTAKRLKYSKMLLPEMAKGKRFLMRSIYGNMEHLDAQYTPDRKDVADYKWHTFLSTSNKAWNGEIGKYIRSKL